VKPLKAFLLVTGAILVALGLYGVRVIWHGFSTADQPSFLETVVARTARNLAIPRKARLEANPWQATNDVLKEARESYVDRCAVCHGVDGAGQTQVGSNLYPKVPDLRSPRTQRLTELRAIAEAGGQIMFGLSRPAFVEWTAYWDAGRAYASQKRIGGKQLRCVSYAKNRDDHSGRKGAFAHVYVYNAGDDRQI
jgi:cytochrome c553